MSAPSRRLLFRGSGAGTGLLVVVGLLAFTSAHEIQALVCMVLAVIAALIAEFTRPEGRIA